MRGALQPTHDSQGTAFQPGGPKPHLPPAQIGRYRLLESSESPGEAVGGGSPVPGPLLRREQRGAMQFRSRESKEQLVSEQEPGSRTPGASGGASATHASRGNPATSQRTARTPGPWATVVQVPGPPPRPRSLTAPARLLARAPSDPALHPPEGPSALPPRSHHFRAAPPPPPPRL